MTLVLQNINRAVDGITHLGTTCGNNDIKQFAFKVLAYSHTNPRVFINY